MSARSFGWFLPVVLVACSSGVGAVEYSRPGSVEANGGAKNEETPPSSGGGGLPPPVERCAKDECPAESGVVWRCLKRFVYGTNLAWADFGSDFGGSKRVGSVSLSQNPTRYSRLLKDAKEHGANVLRWWMFPDFRGDGITFDSTGKPAGVTQQLLDDVGRALELAAEHDVYLMLTLFSFDGFYPTDENDRDWPTYLSPIVRDPELRSALREKVIRPLMKYVEDHPYGIRVHSWDLMNEPEWAIKGASLEGDPPFSPITSPTATDPVTHQEMKTFLGEVAGLAREESSALLTVGGSLKWARAWVGLDLDFYELHYYPWMEPYYSFNRTPEEIGLTDKPLVLGEFPATEEYLKGSSFTYEQIVQTVYAKGWAGALGWDFGGASAANKDAMLLFADQNSCQTTY